MKESLYPRNGGLKFKVDTIKKGVLDAINKMGGVPMFGTNIPIWTVVLIEFCCAYLLEMLIGSPCSFKLACKVFDPRKDHHMLFESAIICVTVGLMCPMMSFLAAIFYYPYAYQPLVRTIFKAIFNKNSKDNKNNEKVHNAA